MVSGVSTSILGSQTEPTAGGLDPPRRAVLPDHRRSGPPLWERLRVSLGRQDTVNGQRDVPATISDVLQSVAYVTVYDSTDINQWSGIGFHIYHALESAFGDVRRIGPLKQLRSPINRMKRLLGASRGLTYMHEQRAANCKYQSAQAAALIGDADAVFCQGWRPLAYLKTDKPMFCYLDATFRRLSEDYPTVFAPETARDWIDAETRAFNNCSGVFFSSQWAADSAIEGYGVPSVKVRVVPMGANFEPEGEVRFDTPTDTCRLLFIGKDWKRKGGGLAVKVAGLLRERGIPAELLLVGCNVQGNVTAPGYVHQVGFLDKSKPMDRAKMSELLESSHFFLLPVDAEAFGIVFCEASAFGLPSITSDVGGIGSAVTNGVNGYRVPYGSPEPYADVIERLWRSPAEYLELRRSSRKQFEDVLNWRVAGRILREHMIELSGGRAMQ